MHRVRRARAARALRDRPVTSCGVDRRTLGVGIGGSAVVGVAFGMTRFAYGLTLPDVRSAFALSELVLGLIASGTFAGYLVGLLGAPYLSARRGPRAPTTVGGVCGVIGASMVALAPDPGLLAAGAVLSGSAAGWVWAPYSDIVAQVAPPRQRPTLLAVISTGTSLGLLALAAAGVLAAVTSWRLVWVGVALASAAAAFANLLTVPRLEARALDARPHASSTWRRALVPPLVYAVLYFTVVTIYFTYASQATRSGGLGPSAAPVLFALIGASGLVALGTGRMVRTSGAPAVGVGCVCLVSAALVLLALGRTSLAITSLSAVLVGAGYMVGASVLAIWTADVVPDRPSSGFTIALVVGALTSILAPTLMGALIPSFGLSTMLVVVAATTAGVATVVAIRVPTRLGRRLMR